MASREPAYDPYIPAGGNAGQAQNGAGNARTQALQQVRCFLF
jgi:hypothetical protein